jgi:hypothetical protein
MRCYIYSVINFSISNLMFYILQPHNTLCLNTHHPKILYDKMMDPYLHKLRLYQMAIMGDHQLDKSLLQCLLRCGDPRCRCFIYQSARWWWRWRMFVIYGDWLFMIFYYFYILIFNYSLKITNLIFKYKKYRKINNRCH